VIVNGVATGTLSAHVGQTLTVEISGSTSKTDWAALAPVGGNYIAWNYMNGTHTAPTSVIPSATLFFQLPFQSGTYEVRLYANGGYGVLATSVPIVVTWPASTITVNGLSLPDNVISYPGRTVTIQVNDGTGSRTDWVGLYGVGAPATSYASWQYLNGTQTPPSSGVYGATLTFQLPMQIGTWEFRFYANGGYTLLATSSVVTSENQVFTAGRLPPTATNERLTWKYLNNSQTAPATGVSAATVTMTLPEGLDKYVFEFHPNDTSNTIGQSTTIIASCVSSVSKLSVAMPSAASAGSIDLVAPTGCAWTADSPSSFAHITGGTSGEGNGTVTFAVDQNPSSEPRSGQLNLGGYQVIITQAGNGFDSTACEIAVSASIGDAQNGTFNLAAPSDCAWSAAPMTSQVSVAQSAGSGNATVAYQLDPAWAPASTSDLSIGAQPTVIQISGASGPICIPIRIVRVDSSYPIQWIWLCGYPRYQTAPPPAQQSRATLSIMGNNPVVRGQQTQVVLGPAAVVSNAQITNWRFEPEDTTLPTITRPANQGNGARTWGGVMVTTGKVFVTVRRNGIDISPVEPLTIVVNARSFASPTPPYVEDIMTNSIAECAAELSVPPMAYEDLGKACPSFAWTASEATVNNGQNTQGLNQGMRYVASLDTSGSRFKVVINSEFFNLNSPWRSWQTGLNGTIEINLLLANTRRHEESDNPVLGHYGRFIPIWSAPDTNFGTQAEGVVVGPVGLDTRSLLSRLQPLMNTAINSMNTQYVGSGEPCDINKDDSCPPLTYIGFVNWTGP
jgi:hypothetical protein